MAERGIVIWSMVSLPVTWPSDRRDTKGCKILHCLRMSMIWIRDFDGSIKSFDPQFLNTMETDGQNYWLTYLVTA